MIIKNILSSENARLNLRIVVRIADFGFPKSIEDMETLLTAHVHSCDQCLSAVLRSENTLADNGCETYKFLLQRCGHELRLHAPMEVGTHVSEEVVEEYCFNRMPKHAVIVFEQHVIVCEGCQRMLQEKEEYISCIRDALATQTAFNFPSSVVAVRAPQIADGFVNISATIWT